MGTTLVNFEVSKDLLYSTLLLNIRKQIQVWNIIKSQEIRTTSLLWFDSA